MRSATDRHQISARGRASPRLAWSWCVIAIIALALAPVGGQEKNPAKELKYMEVDVGGGLKMKLVHIEAGKFMMGAPKSEIDYAANQWPPLGKLGRSWVAIEGPQHEVEITRPFWMGIYTVTQAEYEKVMDKNSSIFCKAARMKKLEHDINTIMTGKWSPE
jgi:formylglycine-generating enzyme required for sulfatase activity